MHLGNEVLTPECVALTMSAAGIGLGAAAISLKREGWSRQKLALAAGLGAMVFAAQAINVPVLPGMSAHLVGGVLLAWALGPSLGAWTMAAILAVQALVLGDGGLAALGANVLNMALLPAGLVGACRLWKVSDSSQSSLALRAGFAAAASVPLAALLIVGETALFRSAGELAGWQDFAVRMIGTHLWIGLAEGGLTVVSIAGLAWLSSPDRAPSWKPTIAVAIAAAALVAFTPWLSELPDGYEASAQQAGMDWLLGDAPGQVGNLPH